MAHDLAPTDFLFPLLEHSSDSSFEICGFKFFFWSKACSGCCWSMSVLVRIFLHHERVFGSITYEKDNSWIICMVDPQVQRVLYSIPDKKSVLCLLLAFLNVSKRICFCILNEKDFVVLLMSTRIFYEYRISRPKRFPNSLAEIVFSKL